MNDRDKLIEIIYCAGRDYDDYVDAQHEIGMSAYEDFDSWLADDLLSNGVIVPPCKVGDTVYCIDYVLKIVEKCKVYGLQIVNGKIQLLVDNCECKFVTSIWYLTKEEAEEKLKEF